MAQGAETFPNSQRVTTDLDLDCSPPKSRAHPWHTSPIPTPKTEGPGTDDEGIQQVQEE